MEKKKKKPSAFSVLMGYAGGHKALTYLSLVMSAMTGVLALMPFVYLWKIIKEVIEVSPDFSKATGIVHNGWMAVIFALISMLLYFAALMCAHVSAFRVAGNMKKDLLRHIAKLPIGFADEMGSGKVRRIVTEATASTETMLAHNLPDMAQAIVTPISMVILLFIYDWRFGLACLVPVIMAFAMMFRMAGPSMQEDMKQYQNALENMSNEAVEYVRGIPVVKTFGQTVFSFHRFKKSIDDYGDFCLKYTFECRSSMILFTMFINSAFAFLIGLTLFLTAGGNATQDILVNFLFYVIFTPVIVTTMNRVMFMSENGMKINDAVARINSILEIEPLSEAKNQKELSGAAVELSGVTYRYSDDAKPAVKNLTISADKDQIVALVGPSGSGKTTVAGLISRFFDAQEGSVRIGGVDVKDIGKDELMNTVSYVFQDSKLLKRSIADNLRIAKPDATDEEISAALKAAQCEDIIKRLPQGINTVLGSEGTYLSGGEQQRIAIARAMLKKAPVVILDEATAFADPENEVLVQKAFTELTKHSTVIMIAHRLSTIRNADKIYVLDHGEVSEAGKHEELIAKGGLYSSMWKEYQSAISWKVGDAV
ncbi:MAG: ABC transporter ATP-binding protein [Clostridia bacterium]|nr:ABC transporter ATP-binding protein [Clostridia bacterium]MBR2175773.1 ABC transporter ATP-binding protein [Clostridia bacterium]